MSAMARYTAEPKRRTSLDIWGYPAVSSTLTRADDDRILNRDHQLEPLNEQSLTIQGILSMKAKLFWDHVGNLVEKRLAEDLDQISMT
jgi:hypothetical protein